MGQAETLHTAITDGAVEIVLPYPTLLSALHYNVGFIGNENGPTLFENSPKTYLWPKGAPKSLPTPFSRCFEGMPAFGLPLVLLSLLVNFARIPEQRFQPPAKGSIRLGLMVLREFIRTIYHEVGIHESGAFERGKR